MHAAKRWLAVAAPAGSGWCVRIEPAGPPTTLISRLRAEAGDVPVVLGIDVPIGVPIAYAGLLEGGVADFPAFLRGLRDRSSFFEVCADRNEIGPNRPFYPRGVPPGVRQVDLTAALGVPDMRALTRSCELRTASRPAAAPLFWTLGPNQVGKAALSAWRDVLLPAIADPSADVVLWPFAGALRFLLVPGRTVIAETYPAEALAQLRLKLAGSKRRQGDRMALAGPLRAALARSGAEPDTACAHAVEAGFGARPDGEDQFDALLGLLCALRVLRGERPERAALPADILRWEGWILGQEAAGLPFRGVSVHT